MKFKWRSSAINSVIESFTIFAQLNSQHSSKVEMENGKYKM